MKSKTKIWVIIIGLIALIGIGGAFRYHQVNANTKQKGVTHEVFIKEGQLVHAKNVDFTVNKARVLKNKDQVTVPVTISIQQKGSANYGQKKNNFNYLENVWLNIPYGISNQTDTIFDKSNKRIAHAENLLAAEQPVTMHFSTNRANYDQRDQKMRFSFLVPSSDHYVKYSLLLE